MKKLLMIPLLLAAAACTSTSTATTQPSTSTQPAHEAAGTCADPIVIHASSEKEGIQKERDWIAQHYGYRGLYSQGLGQCNGKAADHLDFTTADGRKVTVYFDISEWFGKY